MAETTLSRMRLLAALEACKYSACKDCPYAEENNCTAELARAAGETIRQMHEEADNYHRELLRQKVETEYQTRRADLLHEQLQRVVDMYVRAELRAQTEEGDGHADND